MKLQLFGMAAVFALAIAAQMISGCTPVGTAAGTSAETKAYETAKAAIAAPVETAMEPMPVETVMEPMPVEAAIEPTPDPIFESSAIEELPAEDFSGFLPPEIVEPTSPIVELKVIYSTHDINCRGIEGVASGLIGVAFVDCDELPAEVRRLCGGELPPSLPCFVRTVDGEPVKKWLGPTNRAGLIDMRDGQ